MGLYCESSEPTRERAWKNQRALLSVTLVIIRYKRIKHLKSYNFFGPKISIFASLITAIDMFAPLTFITYLLFEFHSKEKITSHD